MRTRSATSTGLLGDLRGSVLMEFTLVAPFLIMVTLGLFEFGRILWQDHILNKSVRDATRYLTRVGATCTGTGTGAGEIDNATDVTAAKNLALCGLASSCTAPQRLISYWTGTGSEFQVQVTCFDNSADPPPYRGPAYIPLIRVTAQLTYQDMGFLQILANLGASSLGTPVTLRADHQEMHIGE